MKKSAYLYYPLFILLLYFGSEKIFTTEEYKRLTMDDAPYLIFEYKESLIEELKIIYQSLSVENKSIQANTKIDLPEKKIAMVLGTSRMLFLNHSHFSRNYPDWELFNFSGPVTFPAYYLYILERTIEKGVTPNLLIVETAPFQYSDGTDAFLRSNLAYSFDPKFIINHFNELKRDEVSNFMAKYFFAAYKYPPNFKNIKSRLKSKEDNKTYQVFRTMESWQKKNRGSARNLIPKEDWFQRDYATLQYQAKYKTVPWLYANYKISNRQFNFLEQILVLARKNNIKVMLVNPAVSSPLLNAAKSLPNLQKTIRKYLLRIQQLEKEYLVKYIDYNKHPSYRCNTFVDDAHMATSCYNLMMADLMRQWYLQ